MPDFSDNEIHKLIEKQRSTKKFWKFGRTTSNRVRSGTIRSISKTVDTYSSHLKDEGAGAVLVFVREKLTLEEAIALEVSWNKVIGEDDSGCGKATRDKPNRLYFFSTNKALKPGVEMIPDFASDSDDDDDDQDSSSTNGYSTEDEASERKHVYKKCVKCKDDECDEELDDEGLCSRCRAINEVGDDYNQHVDSDEDGFN